MPSTSSRCSILVSRVAPGSRKKRMPAWARALVENQLPEIAVGNDQDPLLLPGDCQHVLIGTAGREIAGNG